MAYFKVVVLVRCTVRVDSIDPDDDQHALDDTVSMISAAILAGKKQGFAHSELREVATIEDWEVRPWSIVLEG